MRPVIYESITRIITGITKYNPNMLINRYTTSVINMVTKPHIVGSITLSKKSTQSP